MGISRRSATLICLLTFLFVFGFVGCTENDVQLKVTGLRIVQDDLGRPVKLPGTVERVVSLAPSLTESIFAVGAGDKLVGVTTYCNYPEAATEIEKVGDTQTPNIERIVALKPDVVFVSTASQLEAFMATLDQQGIAVYVMDAKSIGEAIDDLRNLGAILGTKVKANDIANDLEKRANEIDANLIDGGQPRVFVQISRSPLFTIGRTSFVTEIVERAGGVSVTRDIEKAFPEFSQETAMASNPEVIILSDSEDNREPNSAFKSSDAMRNGRVYRIDPDIISRPGPRLVDALEQIAGFLNQ